MRIRRGERPGPRSHINPTGLDARLRLRPTRCCRYPFLLPDDAHDCVALEDSPTGVRSAVLQVVATVTIGAYVGLGGLGQYIIAGIPLRRFDMVLGGALLVTALALVLDGVFALAQRVAHPQGLSQSAARPARKSEKL